MAPWVSRGQSWKLTLAAFQISATAALTSHGRSWPPKASGNTGPIQPPAIYAS